MSSSKKLQVQRVVCKSIGVKQILNGFPGTMCPRLFIMVYWMVTKLRLLKSSIKFYYKWKIGAICICSTELRIRIRNSNTRNFYSICIIYHFKSFAMCLLLHNFPCIYVSECKTVVFRIKISCVVFFIHTLYKKGENLIKISITFSTRRKLIFFFFYLLYE